MESNTSNNYIYQTSYYESDSLCYDQMNKREAKAMNRLSRWELPISQQDINLFYSQYKDFIDAAKEYQARVLGYVPYEPPETFRYVYICIIAL